MFFLFCLDIACKDCGALSLQSQGLLAAEIWPARAATVAAREKSLLQTARLSAHAGSSIDSHPTTSTTLGSTSDLRLQSTMLESRYCVENVCRQHKRVVVEEKRPNAHDENLVKTSAPTNPTPPHDHKRPLNAAPPSRAPQHLANPSGETSLFFLIHKIIRTH